MSSQEYKVNMPWSKSVDKNSAEANTVNIAGKKVYKNIFEGMTKSQAEASGKYILDKFLACDRILIKNKVEIGDGVLTKEEIDTYNKNISNNNKKLQNIYKKCANSLKNYNISIKDVKEKQILEKILKCSTNELANKSDTEIKRAISLLTIAIEDQRELKETAEKHDWWQKLKNCCDNNLGTNFNSSKFDFSIDKAISKASEYNKKSHSNNDVKYLYIKSICNKYHLNFEEMKKNKIIEKISHKSIDSLNDSDLVKIRLSFEAAILDTDSKNIKNITDKASRYNQALTNGEWTNIEKVRGGETISERMDRIISDNKNIYGSKKYEDMNEKEKITALEKYFGDYFKDTNKKPEEQIQDFTKLIASTDSAKDREIFFKVLKNIVPEYMLNALNATYYGQATKEAAQKGLDENAKDVVNVVAKSNVKDKQLKKCVDFMSQHMSNDKKEELIEHVKEVTGSDEYSSENNVSGANKDYNTETKNSTITTTPTTTTKEQNRNYNSDNNTTTGNKNSYTIQNNNPNESSETISIKKDTPYVSESDKKVDNYEAKINKAIQENDTEEINKILKELSTEVNKDIHKKSPRKHRRDINRFLSFISKIVNSGDIYKSEFKDKITEHLSNLGPYILKDMFKTSDDKVKIFLFNESLINQSLVESWAIDNVVDIPDEIAVDSLKLIKDENGNFKRN